MRKILMLALGSLLYSFNAYAQSPQPQDATFSCTLLLGANGIREPHFTFQITAIQGSFAIYAIGCQGSSPGMVALQYFRCAQTFSWHVPPKIPYSVIRRSDRVLVIPRTSARAILVTARCATPAMASL